MFALLLFLTSLTISVYFKLRHQHQTLQRQLNNLAARLNTLENPLIFPKAQPREPEPSASIVLNSDSASSGDSLLAPAVLPTAKFASPQPFLVDELKPMDWLQLQQHLLNHPLLNNRISQFFMNGNTLARVGVALLFIGAALLIKLAAQNGLFNLPIEVRLIAIAMGGLILIWLGWRLRHQQRHYALPLQGGGMALLYLTLFAALRLFELLPVGSTFALLLVVCGLSAFLAIAQNSQTLAIIATCGGFLAPIVTSTGTGSHIALFSFYLLLNLGVLTIAWYKSWRGLNLLSFMFTFVIASSWGVLSYQANLWISTQPFLLGFMAIYVAVSILFALRQPLNLRGYIDGTLVFGTPIIGFVLQSQLVKHWDNGLTYSALGFSIFYALLAYVLSDRKRSRLNLLGTNLLGANLLGGNLLSESFLAIAAVFATLAIPLALDNQGTVAAWALEGVALIYIGLRQHRLYAFYSGFLLQLAAAVLVIQQLLFINHSQHSAFLNSAYISGLLMAIAGWLSAYLLQRLSANSLIAPDKINLSARAFKNLTTAALYWGVVWWLSIHGYEIFYHSLNYSSGWPPSSSAWLLLLGSFSTVFANQLGRRLSWQQFNNLDQYLPAFMLLTLLLAPTSPLLIADATTALAWLVSFTIVYGLLYQKDHRDSAALLNSWQHGASAWLLLLVLSWQAYDWLHSLEFLAPVWGNSAPLLILGAVLLLIARRLPRWPLQTHLHYYQQQVSRPIIAALSLLVLHGNISQTGSSAPLPYLPVLNPLDISSLFALFGLYISQRYLTAKDQRLVYYGLGLLLFICLNSGLLRALHHYTQLRLTVYAIQHSTLAQTSLTLLWSSIAMLLMFSANRYQQRSKWLIGAALLAVVVIKLFWLDLDGVGSIARIISFMFVGLLMLVIGYFWPMPNKPPTKTD